jgi:CheY-like chemotaxis protein
MNILIIDDEPDTITYLATWLQDNGYDTCSASDGRSGMQAILSEKPDLVLLDIKMPGQTGLQLYRDMHQREECKNIPVIFITGMVDYQIFDRECGALPKPAACIEKPFDLEALRSAIEKTRPGSEPAA